MSTLNLIVICITAIFATALIGNTVEKVFRVIYDDPEQEGKNDTGN